MCLEYIDFQPATTTLFSVNKKDSFSQRIIYMSIELYFSDINIIYNNNNIILSATRIMAEGEGEKLWDFLF